MKPLNAQLEDARVAVARQAVDYSDDVVAQSLVRLTKELGWYDEERGPFGRIVPHGARVCLKPNLVLHENQGPWGMEPLVTHQALIRAVVEAVLRADPRQVVIGDAPIQGCDFGRMLQQMGLDTWSTELMQRDARFKGIRDFRRTICTVVGGVRQATENLLPEDEFVLFDLGRESLLEPITDQGQNFRVTCYDPRLLAARHAPGRHQYLVSRDIIEADVVINLPKLKTHKKAGLTCALKNLIGINGNKEFLPHHRIGGPDAGGDCYPEKNSIKRALEYVYDRKNMTSGMFAGRFWHMMALPLHRALRLMGDEMGIEGSWSGNDTIWRTCLDLNAILLYGRVDATLADEPQRQVVHIVDAIVAGQGDGPLAPQPLPMGLILAGQNAAAVDRVGAWLLGYDPERIPIVREAFGQLRYRLTAFSGADVVLVGDWGTGRADELLKVGKQSESIIYPTGWRDAVRSNTEHYGKMHDKK